MKSLTELLKLCEGATPGKWEVAEIEDDGEKARELKDRMGWDK